MGTVILYMSLAILFSFLCSILEAVLLSVNDTFLKIKLKEGASFAPTLQELKSDVDQPLIAILTLNTLAHTVGAIGVGTAAADAFPGNELAVTVISVVMTLLVLVVSEIIPKTIGATYWKSLAGFTTTSLNIMVKILKYTGILFILQLFTRMVGGGGHHKSVLSRVDYVTMTEVVSEQGVLKAGESKIINNLLRFNKIKVKEHMTPRSVVELANENLTIEEFYNSHKKPLRFSRIPIYGTDKDHITGFVLKDEILSKIIQKKGDLKLKDIKREMLFVKEETPLPDLLNKLQEQDDNGKTRRIAVVTNQFNEMQGVISVEDAVETLLGMEFVDEMDDVTDMREKAKNRLNS